MTTILKLRFNGVDGATSFTDDSPAPVTLTANNSAALSSTQAYSSPTSLFLPGPNSYLSAASDPAYGIGLSEFTLGCWVYVSDWTRDIQTIFEIGSYTSGILLRMRSNQLELYINSHQWGTPCSIPSGQWHHIAWCRSAGTLRSFLNGTLIDSIASAGDIPTGGLRIGGASHSASEGLGGYIDDLEFLIGEGKYTANFTPTAIPEIGYASAVMPVPTVSSHDPIPPIFGDSSLTCPTPVVLPIYGGASVQALSARIPTATATGFVAGASGGNLTAPAMSATSFGGASSKAASPTATLTTTTTTVEIGHATTRAPASTTAATGLTGGVARTYVSMPFEVSATGRVSTSAGVYAVMPKASVAASGSRRVASAAATAPRPALTATGTAHESANASARMPLASLIGYGGAVLSVGSGRPTVSASAVTGSVGVVTATLPLVVLSSTATQHERGGAALRMPSLVVGPSGRVVAVMPAGRLTSIGHAVVAVTQEAYVLNLGREMDENPRNNFESKNAQMTRYTEFPFTKVVRYLGSYYGVASDGLYLLEGDTNNGVPIEWAFTTCTTDFKAPMKKTVASVYFGGELGPEAEFTVACGELPDQMHQYTTTKQALQRNHRQKFGLGRKARYYAFGVAGDGELNLDSLEFEVANMTRRI